MVLRNKVQQVFLILEIVALGIVAFFWQELFSLNTEIKKDFSPVIGEELVISFNQPVFKKSLEKNFEIRPSLAGFFVWQDLNRKARFIPRDGFPLGKVYQVRIKNIRSWAGVALSQVKFTFQTEPDPEKALGLTPVKTPSQNSNSGLPKIKQVFRKADGQIIEVPESQIKNGKSVIVALAQKAIFTFENGKFIKGFEIIASGPPWQPTPSGSFKVLAKAPNVFSRHAGVWMPWSVRFYNGYFLHEVPIFPSGARLWSKYSGGCIRLAIGKAQEFYNWIDLNTPILIYE